MLTVPLLTYGFVYKMNYLSKYKAKNSFIWSADKQFLNDTKPILKV